MQNLVTLAKIVAARRMTTLPVLEFSPGKGENQSREAALLDMLINESNLTKGQLARRLYGDNSETAQTALRKLKQRLQDKLMNHLFFLDYTDARHPSYRRHEQQCLDLLHQTTVLWREGGQNLVPTMLRKAIRLSEDGEFTGQALAGYSMLRGFAVESNDPALFRQCGEQISRLRKLRDIEEESEVLFWEAKMSFTGEISRRGEGLVGLPATLEWMTAAWHETNSFTVYNNLLKLRLLHQEMLGNFEEVARITGEAEALFAAGKLNKKRFDSRFTKFYRVYALLRTRRLQEGLAVAEEYLAAFHQSSMNWFVYLEHYFLLAMHSGDHDLVANILRRQQQNPMQSKLPPPAQQRWDMYRAYFFLVRPKEAGIRPLLFAQLVQRVPDYARDKQGYNVAILILQFFHYLRENNEEALTGRLESLRKYEGMHLRTDTAVRSRLMFRLLQLVIKSNFDPQVCAKKATSIIQKLRTTTAPGEAFAEVEIIPYELLWELTLKVLEQRRASASLKAAA